MNLARHLGSLSWAVAARLFPLISGFGVLFFVIPHLTVSEFGRYSLIVAIVAFLIYLNKTIVLNPSVKLGAEPLNFSPTMEAAFILSALFYLVTAIIAWFAAPLIEPRLKLHAGDIRLAGLIPFAFWWRDWVFVVYQVQYRMARIFLLDGLYFGGLVLGFILLVKTGHMTSANNVLKVVVFFALLSSLWGMRDGARVIPWRRSLNVKKMMEILSYGQATFGLGLLGILLSSADVTILGLVRHPETVGIYNGGRSIYRVLSLSISAVGAMVLPYSSKLKAEGRLEELKALYEKVISYAFFALLTLSMLLAVISPYIFQLFFGERYKGSALILRILSLGAPLEGVFMMGALILYGAGWGKVVNGISYILTLFLVLSLFLGSYLGGAWGVALGLVITFFTGSVMVMGRAHQLLGTDISLIWGRFKTNTQILIRNWVMR